MLLTEEPRRSPPPSRARSAAVGRSRARGAPRCRPGQGAAHLGVRAEGVCSLVVLEKAQRSGSRERPFWSKRRRSESNRRIEVLQLRPPLLVLSHLIPSANKINGLAPPPLLSIPA